MPVNHGHPSDPEGVRNPYFGSPEPIDSPRPEAAGSLTIELFVGYRIWSLVPGSVLGGRPEHPVLRSTARGTLWEGPEMTAVCTAATGSKRLHPTEAIPSPGCECGIYALKRPAPPPRPWAWALGPIALTGRVLEGRLGYRAERGRILGPLSLSLGGTPPRCLKPMCRRPATWIRIGPRLYLPRCDHHLQPEMNDMRNLTLDEFLGHAADAFEDRYGATIEGA